MLRYKRLFTQTRHSSTIARNQGHVPALGEANVTLPLSRTSRCLSVTLDYSGAANTLITCNWLKARVVISDGTMCICSSVYLALCSKVMVTAAFRKRSLVRMFVVVASSDKYRLCQNYTYGST